MSIKRRNFLRSASTLTLGKLAGLSSAKKDNSGSEEQAYLGIGQSRRRIRVAIFIDTAFPTRDARPVNTSYLDKILEPFQRIEFTVENAAEVLQPKNAELFFHPYGSAIPDDIIPPLRKYLKQGGNWMQLGGIPLSFPVQSGAKGWKVPETRAIMPGWLPFIAPIEISGRLIRKWKLAGNVIRFVTPPVLKKGTLWNLHVQDQYIHDVVMKPLLSGMDRDGDKNARPIQQLDWIDGPYKGGRWVVASCSSYFPPEEIQAFIKLAAFGPVQLVARVETVERKTVVRAELSSADGKVAQYLPAKATIRMWNTAATETAYLGDAFMSLKGDRASAVFGIPRSIDLKIPATAEVIFDLDRTPLGRLTSRVSLTND